MFRVGLRTQYVLTLSRFGLIFSEVFLGLILNLVHVCRKIGLTIYYVGFLSGFTYVVYESLDFKRGDICFLFCLERRVWIDLTKGLFRFCSREMSPNTWTGFQMCFTISFTDPVRF